jgi:hypothetical protein
LAQYSLSRFSPKHSWDYDATQTGYLFVPLAIALMAAAPLGGQLIGKVKPSYVIFVQARSWPASACCC